MLVLSLLAAGFLLGAGDAPPERFLRAGESLRISVVGLMGEGVETRLTRRVEADGTIRLPMIETDNLDATGMTADDLERNLSRRYEQQTAAKRPTVVVSRIDLGEDHELDTARKPAGAAGPVKMTMLNGDDPLTPPPAAFDRAVGAPLEFDAVPFREVVERLRKSSGLSIFVNYQALELQGVDGNTEVTLRLTPDVKLRKTLLLLLDQIGGGFAELGWTWDEGVLTISTADDLSRNTVTVLFDVRPMLDRERDAVAAGGDDAPSEAELLDRLKSLITTTVATDSWQDNGGRVGKIADYNGRLLVTATPAMIRGVAELLDKLRAP